MTIFKACNQAVSFDSSKKTYVVFLGAYSGE